MRIRGSTLLVSKNHFIRCIGHTRLMSEDGIPQTLPVRAFSR